METLARLLPSLGLIVGALLLLRKWSKRGGNAAGAGVKVLARAGLTRGAIVAVVEIGDRRYLLGACDQSVSLLSELDPDEVGDLAFTPPATDAPGTDDRPRMGPIDRLREMTVRTHLERPLRAKQRP